MLPVLNVAKQKITIPYLNKTYTIRPYLVGEEKAMLIAMESKDEKAINEAVKNLITCCVEEKINLDELSYFETEYLFIQLRKISVNNIVEIGIRHQHDEECDHLQKIQIDLEDIKAEGQLDNKIILDEEKKIGVVMKIPSNKILNKKYDSEIEKVFGMIEDCIESIFDEENVYNVKDVSDEELKEWINSLNSNQIKKIAEFFGNLPSFYYDVEYTCSKCGKVEKTKIEGLINFL